jgi:GDPmannose 4,6-dehydratase
MKSIIFGANGQDGFYLSALLKQMGQEVIGVSRGGDFIKCDISDFKEIAELIKNIKPDFVFHLAADSTTRHEAMFYNHEVISTGTLNILEAVRLYAPSSRVFISGSGLQFENKELPIKESDSFEARDPYSVSRIQSVYAARYFGRLGIRAYVGYFFNHDSPRRSERHISQKVVAAARRIAAGSGEKLEIGDLSTEKEWTFAGDVVKAIWTLVSQEYVFESNLGSGLSYSIADWCETVFSSLGMDYRDHVTQKEIFQAEYSRLVSDPTLIYSLGFRPEIGFHELAKMMIDA